MHSSEEEQHGSIYQRFPKIHQQSNRTKDNTYVLFTSSVSHFLFHVKRRMNSNQKQNKTKEYERRKMEKKGRRKIV
jgi:hypothetical protein